MKHANLLQAPEARDRHPRPQGPIHWDAQFCGGAWLLSDYADVAAALRDPRFSVRRTSRWINSSIDSDLADHGKRIMAQTELRPFKRIFARSLLFMEGASHQRLRRILHAGFTPSVLQSWAPRIESIVDGLIDRIVDQAVCRNDAGALATFDVMRDFARPLPAMVMADMLGIAADEQTDFIGWAADVAAFIGSPTPTMPLALAAQAALLAMRDFFAGQLAARRARPGEDLIGLLIRAESQGLANANELLAQCCTLLFAGYETTRNLLGNGLLTLLQHPQQWQALRQAPDKLPSALRELLRYDSPVQYTGRRLTAEVALHGRQLKKGDLVILLIGAANRDPRRFTDPEQLDITRDEGNHLAFGYGPHVCLGATLTYLEAEIAFRALLRRLPLLQQGPGAVTRQQNAAYRGLDAFPATCVVHPVQHDDRASARELERRAHGCI